MNSHKSAATSVKGSDQLRPFVLNGVVSTEKTLGTGSYGSVLEVCSYSALLADCSYCILARECFSSICDIFPMIHVATYMLNQSPPMMHI